MWSLSMPSSVAAKKLDLGRRRKGKTTTTHGCWLKYRKGINKHRVFFDFMFVFFRSMLRVP